MTEITADQYEERLASFIRIGSQRGWEVTSSGAWGIQFRRRKVLDRNLLWVGATLLIFGIGVIVWLFALLDYCASQDTYVFISREDVLDGAVARHLR